MGGYRRAAFRQSQRALKKINQAKGPNAEAMRCAEKGRADGLALAMCSIFIALHDEYGFKHTKNGSGRLDRLLYLITNESMKYDQESTKFVCDNHQKKIIKKLEEAGITQKVFSPMEHIYTSNRDMFFVRGIALIFMALED